MIVIINGPLGAGKTETSWHLLERFDHGVMLDGDFIGAVHPFELHSEARVSYLYQTLALLVAHHHQNGYSNFVINYVFETPQSLALLRGMLTPLDSQIIAFRLKCSPEVLEHRIRRRNPDASQLAWELKRGPELAGIQEQAARHGDLGYSVDSTLLDARQTALLIWEIIQQL